MYYRALFTQLLVYVSHTCNSCGYAVSIFFNMNAAFYLNTIFGHNQLHVTTKVSGVPLKVPEKLRYGVYL